MKYISILSLTLVLMLGSCNITNNDCEKFKDSYRITDFDRSLKSITYNTDNELTFDLAEITDNEITSNRYAININPVEEFYKSTATNNLTIGGSSVAYACSPPDPTTDALITDIQIMSDEDFSQQYPSGSDLKELFDIITVREGQANEIVSVKSFLESPRMVPNNILLVLNQAPDTARKISFYVVLELKNVGYRYYSFVTSLVTIKPSK